MKKHALLLLLSTSAFSTGCSSSGGVSSALNPPAVEAATYSNASITGTYAFNFTQITLGTNSTILTSTGTFVADGNGNITSATSTARAGGNSCTQSLTGTYTVQSDASGTMSVTAAASGANTCPGTGTLHLVIQVAQQGQALLLTQNDPNVLATGTALKQ